MRTTWRDSGAAVGSTEKFFFSLPFHSYFDTCAARRAEQAALQQLAVERSTGNGLQRRP